MTKSDSGKTEVLKGAEPKGSAFFRPDITPEQAKKLGVLEGKYTQGNPLTDNFFKIDASMSEWPDSWHNPQHPQGWFQWWEGYAAGKRTDDDERQIKRWISFKARHLAQLRKADPTLENLSIQPRRRQALLNWGIAPGIKMENKFLEKIASKLAQEELGMKRIDSGLPKWMPALGMAAGAAAASFAKRKAPLAARVSAGLEGATLGGGAGLAGYATSAHLRSKKNQKIFDKTGIKHPEQFSMAQGALEHYGVYKKAAEIQPEKGGYALPVSAGAALGGAGLGGFSVLTSRDFNEKMVRRDAFRAHMRQARAANEGAYGHRSPSHITRQMSELAANANPVAGGEGSDVASRLNRAKDAFGRAKDTAKDQYFGSKNTAKQLRNHLLKVTQMAPKLTAKRVAGFGAAGAALGAMSGFNHQHSKNQDAALNNYLIRQGHSSVK